MKKTIDNLIRGLVIVLTIFAYFVYDLGLIMICCTILIIYRINKLISSFNINETGDK